MKVKWSSFESYTDELIEKIRNNGYSPDVIVAVGKSGLIPSALIAKKLKIQNIQTIIISSYDEQNRKFPPRVISSNLSDFLKDKNLLIVDDIVASGETFSKVKEQIEPFKPKNVKFSAVVISEFVCKKYPDFYGKSIMRGPDDFISMPWD